MMLGKDRKWRLHKPIEYQVFKLDLLKYWVRYPPPHIYFFLSCSECAIFITIVNYLACGCFRTSCYLPKWTLVESEKEKKGRKEIDLKIGQGENTHTHTHTQRDHHIPFQSTERHKMSNQLKSLARRRWERTGETQDNIVFARLSAVHWKMQSEKKNTCSTSADLAVTPWSLPYKFTLLFAVMRWGLG